MNFKNVFDTFNHKVLLSAFRKRIIDEPMRKLIYKMLKCRYIFPKNFVDSKLELDEGTPQGSVLSPLMANIYFHLVDEFMVQNIISKFTKEKLKYEAINLKYYKIVFTWNGKKWNKIISDRQKVLLNVKLKKIKKMFKRLRVREIQKRNLLFHIRSEIKITYIRYADDFLIGVKGTKKVVKSILLRVLYFCESELKMEIHSEKTDIKHRSKGVYYLGYKI